MTSESVKSAVEEIREARAKMEKLISEKDQQIQGLEFQVRAIRAELESVTEYYAGMNTILDRLASVKGAVHQQRIALDLLHLRDRKKGLKKVERPEE